MAQAACPRCKMDSMHSKPQVQGGKHPLPAPGERQKSQLFPRSGVESILSLPIQSPGVIPLIQRGFEQHLLDLLCLEQGSSGGWAGQWVQAPFYAPVWMQDIQNTLLPFRV